MKQPYACDQRERRKGSGNSPAATETFKDSSPGGSCRPGRMVRRSWQEACTARDRPEPSFPAEQGGQRVTEAPAGQAGKRPAQGSGAQPGVTATSRRTSSLSLINLHEPPSRSALHASSGLPTAHMASVTGLCAIAPGRRAGAPPLWQLARSFPVSLS